MPANATEHSDWHDLLLLTTVPVQGRHAHQGCHLAAAEMSQLGQVGDQHGGRSRPDTRPW